MSESVSNKSPYDSLHDLIDGAAGFFGDGFWVSTVRPGSDTYWLRKRNIDRSLLGGYYMTSLTEEGTRQILESIQPYDTVLDREDPVARFIRIWEALQKGGDYSGFMLSANRGGGVSERVRPTPTEGHINRGNLVLEHRPSGDPQQYELFAYGLRPGETVREPGYGLYVASLVLGNGIYMRQPPETLHYDGPGALAK